MKIRLLFCLVIFTLCFGIQKATAQVTYVWNGGTSGNWTTASNWLLYGVVSTYYPGQVATNDIAYFNNSNVTANLTASLTISQVQSSYGVAGCSINLSSGKTLNVTAGLNVGQPSSAATVLTLEGSGKYVISGTSSPGYFASLAIASGTTVYFNINSTLSMINSQKNVTNAGTLIFLSGSTFNVSSSINAFTNTGSVISYSSTFNVAQSGNSTTFANNGTFRDHGSTFNITGQGANIQNTGTSTSFYGSGTTIAFGPTTNNNNILNNTASFKVDSGSLINMTTQSCTITNTGSSATFTLSASTLNMSTSNTVNITNSSSATFTAPNSTINISGYQNYINNSATFTAGSSGAPCVINISGSGNTIGANTSIYNTGTFTLGPTSIINATGTNASAPNIVYNNGGTFTLQSDATGSATIGTLGNGGSSLQGKFNVQRYLTPGYRGYRLFSCPVNQTGYTPSSSNVTDISYLGSSTYTTGEFIAGPGSGFGSNGTLSHTVGNPTLYLYQESALPGANYNLTFTSGKNIGIYAIGTNSVTTTSTATNGISASGVKIPPGNGYISYFIGPYNITSYTATAPATATTTAPGYINQGTITLYLWGTSPSSTLTYTTSSGYRNPGYTMVGNPYPATLDLKALYNDAANSSNNQKVINPSFYELNDQTQSYVTYNTGTGSSGTGNSEYVASGQGFFISVVSGIAGVTNKSLTFSESDKASSTTTPTFPSPLLLAVVPKANNATPGLHLKLMQDSVNYDECGLYFNSNWKDTYDEKTDSYDLDGEAPQVFLSSYTSDNVRTSVNALSNYTSGKRIRLFVKALTDGIYSLNLEDIFNIDTTNFNVYLIDNQQNDSLDMVHYKTYNFNLTAADTAAFHNRFVLVIERKAMPPYSLVTFTGQKANSAIQLNWKTNGEGNYTGFGLEKLGANGQYALIDSAQSNGTGLYTYNDLTPVTGSNIYRLAQNDINGKVTFAGPININYNAISASGAFTIYPNPSKDIINVAVNSGTTGNAVIQTYLANIYSLGGTLMNTRQLNTNNFTQDITGYKPGVYILELKTTDGDVIGKAKFVKTN